MSEQTQDKSASPLCGQRVCFTGELASLTRKEASELVRSLGGAWLPVPTRNTTLVVVGDVDRTGRRPSVALRKARTLQQQGASLRILNEDQFLEMLRETDSAAVASRYTLGQLVRILDVPRDRLRRWIRIGLIEPVEIKNHLAFFNFGHVVRAKRLAELHEAGYNAERIRKDLSRLEEVLPGVQPLENLAQLDPHRPLSVRLADGTLVEPTGQRLFDFDGEPSGTDDAVSISEKSSSSDYWFSEGVAAEETGRLEEAAEAYRQALLLGGPNAETNFNLGNVLYELGKPELAAERFHQCLEIEPGHAEGWNNLGNVMLDGGQVESAVAAFQRALTLVPNYADAHFNLAEALIEAGRKEQARDHYRQYLQLDSQSEWADHARAALSD